MEGKFYPACLIAQTLLLLNTICSGRCRTGCQKLGWFILCRQAGAVLMGWNPQIARKMGKRHSFRWAILWVIILYMLFLNKRSNFEKKPHELSYRSNITSMYIVFIYEVKIYYSVLKKLIEYLFCSISFRCLNILQIDVTESSNDETRTFLNDKSRRRYRLPSWQSLYVK